MDLSAGRVGCGRVLWPSGLYVCAGSRLQLVMQPLFAGGDSCLQKSVCSSSTC